MKIYTRDEWGAQRDNGVANRPVRDLEKNFHHTVTKHLSQNASLQEEMAQMRVIERIGQERFGRGISYNLLGFPSGRFYWGATIDRVSYHTGAGYNTRGIGFCWAGNYDVNRPTPQLIEASAQVLSLGVKLGWWRNATFTRAHRDVKATSCPGRFAFEAMRQINSRALALAGGATPVNNPIPVPTPFTYTTEYIREVQQLLNATGERLVVDGSLGNLTREAVRRFQHKSNLVVDGDPGPLTMHLLRNWSVDMRLISAPNRGTAIFGAGYFQPLDAEAAAVFRNLGLPVRNGNDREYDVIKHNTTAGIDRHAAASVDLEAVKAAAQAGAAAAVAPALLNAIDHVGVTVDLNEIERP